MMGFGWWFGPWMMAYWITSIVAIIWALADISRQKKDAGYKVIWAGICVFLGILGVLIYWILEKKR
jgi:hypothetical protein